MGKIIVCNQKMFLDKKEAQALSSKLEKYNNDNLIVCPNFLNIGLYDNFNLCAQNCYYEDDGAYTGEVSCKHLKSYGINYVLIGHSERRNKETDEEINKKVLCAINNDVTPILCIGETLYERQMNKTADVIKRQLKKDLKNINSNVIIAYEPRWLIGGKDTLSKEEIEDTYKYIKKILDTLNIKNYKILYGGSITKDNIKNTISDKLDGYLIGKACINIEELDEIIKCINM